MNKINLLSRLMMNSKCSEIILSQLSCGVEHGSLTHENFQLCKKYDTDFFKLLLDDKRINLQKNNQRLPQNVYKTMSNSVKFWSIPEERRRFRDLLEENVVKARSTHPDAGD